MATRPGPDGDLGTGGHPTNSYLMDDDGVIMTVDGCDRARTKLLEAGAPHLIFEDDYMNTEVGTRGLVRIRDRRGDVIGLEFIEPEEFWADPDAVEEYAETLEEGVHVTVIVPDGEKADAEELLHEEAGQGGGSSGLWRYRHDPFLPTLNGMDSAGPGGPDRLTDFERPGSRYLSHIGVFQSK